MQNSPSESELIALAQTGDQDAFLDLIAAHDQLIMGVIVRFGGDQFDRQDIYQNVFLAVFKAIGRFQGTAKFSTWLYRVAFNQCLNYYRKHLPVASMLQEPVHPGPDWNARAQLQAIHRALTRLKGPIRLCFHLFYIEQWGLSEIAEVLELKEGSVKSYLDRARKHIRQNEEVRAWINAIA
ncbi:MAG: RNA polymerase sigma factor [Acidobacteria bacterium]|nr:RNA polymerase sigma factor [Acidobacteriota bacterium]